MNIFCQICSDTGKGFKKPCQQSFQLLFVWHLSQFWQNVQTFCSISSQKNCYDKRASVTSLSECSVIVESCVYWISSVQRDFDDNTQCLSWKSSFSSSLKKHSVMNILTFKTVKNNLCFLQTSASWESDSELAQSAQSAQIHESYVLAQSRLKQPQ